MQHIGYSSPLGATIVDGGVNFSLFSRSATGVESLFFDPEDSARPARVIRFDSCGQPDVPLLARVCAGSPARAAIRLPRYMKLFIYVLHTGCGLTPPKCSLTHTAAVWWFLKTTVATRPAGQATTPRQR